MNAPNDAALRPPLWNGSTLAEVPLRAYTDAELYARELERIFYGPHWCYVGLEAEIPNPGDFKRTFVGERQVILVRGKDGERLADKWAEGPRTYLGLSVAGFPNLFTITGPGSPSVLTNMLPTIEQHVDWIADCIDYMRERNFRRIEATPDAETAWVAEVNRIADGTLFPTCNSWYLGANIPGKPRVFMPYIGFPPYVETCNAVAASGYSGFALS